MLATNLRENLDEAFTRRFDAILQLPAPGAGGAPPDLGARVSRERAAAALDLDALARLDLTGAGIVATARTAALLAADEDARRDRDAARRRRRTARQFRREGRVLSRSQLGDQARALGA